MISQYTITGVAWTPISTVGQSVKVWLDEDDDGAVGKVDVRIYHTEEGTPGDDVLTISKRVFKPNSNVDVFFQGADNSLDVYYLRCKNEGDEAQVTVDAFTPSESTAIIAESFELAVVKGLVPGHSWIDKYGENPDIDTGTVPESLWEYGGLYTFDTINTAPIVSVVSDSALDTQEIEVPTGLDIDGKVAYQKVQLNGTTRVALDTPLWRFNRAANDADEGNDLNGTVYFYTGTGNVPAANEIRGIIDNGNNQTLMALYTIPLGKVGFLMRGEVGASRSLTAGAIEGAYFSRRVGKVMKVKKRVNLVNSGSSIYQDKRVFPDPIPALTDIELRVLNVSANNSGVFGTFDLMLVDETEFTQSYLDNIGQPSEMPS